MKILFIEDELTDNISRIINIFGGILGAKIKKRLEIAEQDRSFPDEIKGIIEDSLIIDVCYCFPDALKKIQNNYNDYELFIIDRDLSEMEYGKDDVTEIFPEFTDDYQIMYLRREGDFLLSCLRDKLKDYNSMVYFLTANATDSLKCKDELVEPGLTSFMTNNIMDKSNPNDVKKLTEIIEDFKKGNFRVKMKDVFEVFDDGLLTQDIEQEFVETLRKMNVDNPTTVKDNLGRIRRVLEAIYIELAKQSPDLIPEDRIKFDKDQLLMSAIFNHLKKSGRQPDFINSLSWDIWTICSQYGAHSQTEKVNAMPSKHTVQALAHALCEVLLWFKEVVNE